MKAVYVDTSALVAIVFEEKEGATVRAKLAAADEAFSSVLMEAELLAALARERVPFGEAAALLSGISLLSADGSLRGECEEALSHAYVRGADLWHLATALSLVGSASRAELLFLTLDTTQKALARKLGFRT